MLLHAAKHTVFLFVLLLYEAESAAIGGGLTLLHESRVAPFLFLILLY